MIQVGLNATVGISRETSIGRTPQQNGVVVRRNRTLVEAARTMLIFTQALLFLWAEVFSLDMHPRRKLTVFTTDVPKIIETINVDFDELAAMASEQLGSGPRLQCITPATPSSGLVPNPPPLAPFVPPSRHEWDLVFQPVFDEFFSPPASICLSSFL
ncbi:retrovirus-related pol polyprotein from transposon TNT 1-94 [Tanacetum coccineum]